MRDLCYHLGLDRENFGSKNWNPFGEFVRPGNIVIIKPNLVFHEKSYLSGSCAVATHSSILRPIIDYCLIALRGEGRCIICDAPLQSADLGLILSETRLSNLLEFYTEKGFPVEFYDLRLERVVVDNFGFFLKRIIQKGDPAGYIEIDLGEESALEPITRYDTLFGVSDYDPRVTNAKHQKGQHNYLISRSVLNADVFINVPKLKTHQKAGITVSLKNLVGINGHKDYLPHFQRSGFRHKGDEFPPDTAFFSFLIYYIHSRLREYLQGRWRLLFIISKEIWKMAKKMLGTTDMVNASGFDYARYVKHARRFLLAGGAWWGNDTLWRTILDINKILFYCDKEGKLKDQIQRRYFVVVDGIIAGEGNGPIEPIPRKAGVLLSGFNPVALDLVAALIMGFDPFKVPVIRHAGLGLKFFADSLRPDVMAKVDGRWQKIHIENLPSLNFLAPPGWLGFIERKGHVESF